MKLVKIISITAVAAMLTAMPLPSFAATDIIKYENFENYSGGWKAQGASTEIVFEKTDRGQSAKLITEGGGKGQELMKLVSVPESAKAIAYHVMIKFEGEDAELSFYMGGSGTTCLAVLEKGEIKIGYTNKTAPLKIQNGIWYSCFVEHDNESGFTRFSVSGANGDYAAVSGKVNLKPSQMNRLDVVSNAPKSASAVRYVDNVAFYAIDDVIEEYGAPGTGSELALVSISPSLGTLDKKAKTVELTFNKDITEENLAQIKASVNGNGSLLGAWRAENGRAVADLNFTPQSDALYYFEFSGVADGEKTVGGRTFWITNPDYAISGLKYNTAEIKPGAAVSFEGSFYSWTESFDKASLLTVVYDKDNTAVSFSADEGIVPNETGAAGHTNVSVPSADGEYRIVSYIWDSLYGMKTLNAPVALSQGLTAPEGEKSEKALNTPIITDGKTYLSGTITAAADKRIQVEVLKPGVTEDSDFSNLSPTEFNETYLTFFEVTANSEGTWRTPDFAIGDLSGDYSVRINYEDSNAAPVFYKNLFRYISAAFGEKLVNAANGEDAEAAAEFIVKNISLIADGNSDYEALSDEELKNAALRAVEEKKNIDGGVFKTPERVADFVNRAIMLSHLTLHKDNAYNLILKYAPMCNFEEDYPPFKYLKKADKSAFDSVSADAAKLSITEWTEKYGMKIFKSACANVSISSEVESILIDTEDWLGIDLSAYKKLKDKKSVNLAVMKFPDDTKEEFKTYFDKTVKSAASSSSSKGNTSSGSSGSKPSGPSGSATVTPAATPAPKPAPTEAPQHDFSDMQGFEWANEAVKALYDEKIISGVGEDKFEPSREVTREEFVKMLAEAFKIPQSDEKINFFDVSESDWFAPYVSAAAASGMVNGISDELFGTGKSITRADMAVMAYRAAGLSKADGKTFADDGEIPDYAKEAVYALNAAGIISGTGDNKFSPAASANRAEAAKIIYMLKNLNGGKSE